MIQSLLAVFVGGGFGAIARFGIGKALVFDQHWFYFGTFAANIISSLLLGYLVALSLKGEINEQAQLLLMTGFCGGFSTFSTFSLENYNLLQEGNFAAALTYSGLSILAGLGCIYLGLRFGNP